MCAISAEPHSLAYRTRHRYCGILVKPPNMSVHWYTLKTSRQKWLHTWRAEIETFVSGNSNTKFHEVRNYQNYSWAFSLACEICLARRLFHHPDRQRRNCHRLHNQTLPRPLSLLLSHPLVLLTPHWRRFPTTPSKETEPTAISRLRRDQRHTGWGA